MITKCNKGQPVFESTLSKMCTRRSVLSPWLILLIISAFGCHQSAVPTGIYSGQFSWQDGLKSATLTLKSDPRQGLDLRNKEIRNEIESAVRAQIERANVHTAEGIIAVSIEGSSPLLVTLKRFDIQTPNFSELLSNVDSGNVGGIKRFVTRYGSANQRDLPSQRTALFYAAAGCKVGSAQALLAAGSDPNLPDFEGDTPLSAAVTADCVDAARELLASGANVDNANQNGETPLIRAVKLRKYRLLKVLLEKGANPNYVLPDGRSALTLAREEHDQAAISALQRFGALR